MQQQTKQNKQKVNKVNVNNSGMYKLKLTVRKEVGEKREKDESAKDGEEVKKKVALLTRYF